MFYAIDVSVMLVYKLSFKASSLPKLLYAPPTWSGFTTANDRQQVNAFLRRSKQCGFCRQDLLTFEKLLENSDEQLFNMIIYNTQHVLYSLLPQQHHNIST